MLTRSSLVWITELLVSPDDDERQDIIEFTNKASQKQFNWGELLSLPVRGLIKGWAFDDDTLAGKPHVGSFEEHVLYLKALTEDNSMITRFKTGMPSQWNCVSFLSADIPS